MSAKRLTKAQVIAEIAEYTELDKKSVGRVFDGLTELIKKELRKPNGEFVIPGLLKLRAIKKPATKDRPGINPFTKQPITIKGKPAQKKVRATALKALKDSHPVTGRSRSAPPSGMALARRSKGCSDRSVGAPFFVGQPRPGYGPKAGVGAPGAGFSLRREGSRCRRASRRSGTSSLRASGTPHGSPRDRPAP